MKVKFNTKIPPIPDGINSTCGNYYIVKVQGYRGCYPAMYLEDEQGNCAWYTNYFSKIIKPIEGWAEIDNQIFTR